jgi:tagatose 1,6-diphosphate aldolase GatY/KbaY
VGAAVPVVSCYGASTAVSVAEAAEAAGLPVVVLVPPVPAAAVEGPRAMGATADSAAVPVSVQLDHASDPHLIAAALRAGVDAVLADGSTLPPEENAAFVRTIRELGGPGVTIEAELGGIAGHEDRANDLRATRVMHAWAC